MAAPVPEVQRAIRIAERQARHLRTLVEDIFDVSRLERGGILLYRRPMDLKHAVHEVLESYGVLADVGERRFSTSFPSVPVVVDADPTRLQQIIGNLVDNAVKYTARNGRIDIGGGIDGPHAVLHVRDDGIGIAPEVLPRVFDMFSQADSLRARSAGLGIGLALVRSLVHLHGGSVTAASPGIGQGAAFTVRLPLATRGARPAPDTGARARVLLVDADRESREMLRLLLEAAGHAVDIAPDAIAAAEMARAIAYDLVIVGLGRADADAFTIASRLRAGNDAGHGGLIAVTDPGAIDQHGLEESGFDACIARPIDPDDVARTLARLGHARGRPLLDGEEAP